MLEKNKDKIGGRDGFGKVQFDLKKKKILIPCFFVQ